MSGFKVREAKKNENIFRERVQVCEVKLSLHAPTYTLERNQGKWNAIDKATHH